jgi:RNA polymerase sigma-70 factor (ECF subfamily)
MGHGDGWTSRKVFEDLLHLARQGDRAALGKILDAFRRVLRRRLERREPMELRPKCAPSDLVQDTLLEAHRDFASFRGGTPEELASWLNGILRHNLRDLLRFHDSRKRERYREVALEDCRKIGNLKEQLVDRESSPEEAALREEQAQAVRRALGQLVGRAREAVRLRYEERLSYEEVGAQLGCSAEAARKLCARALDAMRGTDSLRLRRENA